MAYRKNFQLPLTTQIEVVAVKGELSVKKVINVSDIPNVEKKKGWRYYFFQLGFSQFNNKVDFSKPLTHKENNSESQKCFEKNKTKLSNQCKKVYEALKRGERLTTATALIKYKIGDLRRRCKDLKDTYGVDVKSKYIDGRYKEYYL